MAQNDGEPPVFFEFGDRDSHDLDKVAKKFSFDDNLGAMALNQSLMTEYHRTDRYWKTIYYNYQLFKSQYDACVNRLLDINLHGNEYVDHNKVLKVNDERQDREPSNEIKEQVKARDGYQCLCCGENNKRRLQIDHVAPSYYGGNNSQDNLQTLCRVCNQNKGINTLNFRIHQTVLTVPPSNFLTFEIPSNAKNSDEWFKFLRRSINFFYHCSAVEFVKIGKRGKYFHEWYVYLFAGNNPAWIQPHLNGLVQKINAARRNAGLQEIKSITVGSPDEQDVGV
jgi:ATP-dependent helicase IRC3